MAGCYPSLLPHIFVEGFGRSTSEGDLAQLCSNFGRVRDVVIVGGRNSYGIVTLASDDDVERILRAGQLTCRGRRLRVTVARIEERRYSEHHVASSIQSEKRNSESQRRASGDQTKANQRRPSTYQTAANHRRTSSDQTTTIQRRPDTDQTVANQNRAGTDHLLANQCRDRTNQPTISHSRVITEQNVANQRMYAADQIVANQRRSTTDQTVASQKRSTDQIVANKKRSTDQIVANQKRSTDQTVANQKRSTDQTITNRRIVGSDHTIVSRKQSLRNDPRHNSIFRTSPGQGRFTPQQYSRTNKSPLPAAVTKSPHLQPTSPVYYRHFTSPGISSSSSPSPFPAQVPPTSAAQPQPNLVSYSCSPYQPLPLVFPIYHMDIFYMSMTPLAPGYCIQSSSSSMG